MLPFRYFEIVSTKDDLTFSDLNTYVRANTGDGEVELILQGHFARYDMISFDPATGDVALSLGKERALDPEEFSATVPPGHLPLCAAFTTNEGSEIIDQTQWRDLIHQSRQDDHLAWIEYCRARLPRTMQKLQFGGSFKLSGYGDSTTALGGRTPEHAISPGGTVRDTIAYFECYGADWLESVRAQATDRKRKGHRLGWNWFLKAAIETRSACEVEYENWGIAGTTSAADCKTIGSFDYPNALNPARLDAMLAGEPDLVTLAVGINDIGEGLPTRQNVVAIGQSIQRAGADLIVLGPCRPNPRFSIYRDDHLWKETNDLVIAAAHDLDAAFFDPWEIYGDGNEGAMGVSRRSHCASSMGNHPGARELESIGRYLAKLIP